MPSLTEAKKYSQKIFNLRSKTGQKWQRWLGLLNLVFIGLLIYEIIYGTSALLKTIEITLGSIFALELTIRWWITEKKTQFYTDWFNLIDAVVIMAVFGKYFVYDALLLQLISGLRLLRSYRVLSTLAKQHKQVFFYYETLKGLLTLFLFVFIMSGVVVNLLGPKNPAINNFTDALYFTITTLTTTGFGDITVEDRTDKLVVIFIMIFGASLFLKLATSLFKGRKVFYRCKECGLTHHEADASHCKHCGSVIDITTDGTPN